MEGGLLVGPAKLFVSGCRLGCPMVQKKLVWEKMHSFDSDISETSPLKKKVSSLYVLFFRFCQALNN